MKLEKYLLLFFLTFCLNFVQASELEKVKLQLQWKYQFQFAGFIMAKELGYYRDAGLDVEILEYNNTSIMDDLEAGQVDYAINNSILAYDDKKLRKVSLLASYFQRSPLIFITQPEIKSVLDLEGKRVMISYNNRYNSSLSILLDYFELNTPEKVEFLQPTFDIEDFINKKTDAVTAFRSNEVFELNQRNIPFNIIDPVEYGFSTNAINLYTSHQKIQNKPQQIRKFLEATKKGWQYSLDNIEKVAQLIHEKYRPEKTYENLIYEGHITKELMLLNLYDIGEINKDFVLKNFNQLQKQGKIIKSESPERLIYEAQQAPMAIVDFTDAEKNFIKQHPEIIVGGEMDWPPYDFVKDGEYQGAANDYLQLLESKTGLSFTIKTGFTWNELLALAKNRKIDVLPMVWYSEERTEFLNYTKPYLNIRHYIFVPTSDKSTDNIDDLTNKTIAIPKGYAQIKYLHEHYPDIEILEVDGSIAAIDSVITGKADALIENTALVSYYSREMNITGLRPVEVFDVTVSELHMTTRKDWPILRDILQKGLDAIENEERFQIAKRWTDFVTTDEVVEKFELNQDEKSYLEQKKIIKVGIDPNFAPFEWFDENGDFRGVSKDFLAILSEKLTVEFEVVKTDSWQETLELAQLGDIDMLTDAVKTPEREKFLSFTDFHIDTPVVIFAHQDKGFIGDIKRLKGKKLAVVSGYFMVDILTKSHPEIELIRVENEIEAFDLLLSGGADAFIGDGVSSNFLLQKEGIDEIKYSGEAPNKSFHSMAVTQQNLELLPILQKTIKTIPSNQKERIIGKWMATKINRGLDKETVVIYALLILLVIAIVIIWNLRLRRSKETLEENETKLNQLVEEKTHHLKLAKEEAEIANKEKSRFLANMSHELRTPMHAILSFASLGLKRTEEQKAFGYFDKIHVSGKRLTKLLDDLLDLSKLESGKLEPDFENNDIGIVMLECIESVESLLNEKNISINFNYETEVIGFFDEKLITQVIINLLSNAIKFSPEDTQVNVIIRTDKNEQTITVSVTDEGVGIPKNEIIDIFDQFVQSTVTRTGSGGTGLGLPISKEIIHLHHGKIWAESPPEGKNSGSSFIFQIPIQQ